MSDQQLEYNNIYREERGALTACRLTFRTQQIIFKNIKTGKPSTIQADQIKTIEWQRLAKDHGLRIITESGSLYRFDGFKPDDFEKIKRFIEKNFKKQLTSKKLSIKGFNWGSTLIEGESLAFNVDGEQAFEIPLTAVQDCTSSKNEVILNFHHNDDAAVCMTDMRFHMPNTSNSEEAIKAFVDSILSRASVLKVTGQSIATFSELQCLTPRGRYDIKFFPTFIQLHGKTFDYKIRMDTILRLFQLPHKDGRQVYFIISLDPPLVQGQTRYQFLQLLFYKEDEIEKTMDMDEKELKEKFDGILTKEMSGPLIDVFSTVVKAAVKRKINIPDYHCAISSSFKNNNGFLYPLDRGFMYVHKPAIHIRFEEISAVNFARSDGSTRSFDLEIETKAGATHIFSSIEKEEYGKLFEYIQRKKLRIKNRNITAKNQAATEVVDDMIDSDDDDAYLARVREEGRTRDQEDSESEDEDFNPEAENSGSGSSSESEKSSGSDASNASGGDSDSD